MPNREVVNPNDTLFLEWNGFDPPHQKNRPAF